MEYAIVGDEIWVNGFKIADIQPAKALTVTEIENFKDFIKSTSKNSRVVKEPSIW